MSKDMGHCFYVNGKPVTAKEWADFVRLYWDTMYPEIKSELCTGGKNIDPDQGATPGK